ncbi:MAG: STAS domain-containing protein [Acidimicrobiales bacterium]
MTQSDGWSVVAVTGELELATAPRLRQQIVSLIGGGRSHLIIDLAGVDFIDSVGLGVVVGALKRCRTHGGDLVVVGAVPRVRSLFEITRLDEIIDMHPDVERALAAVGPAPATPAAPTSVAPDPSPSGPTTGELVPDG